MREHTVGSISLQVTYGFPDDKNESRNCFLTGKAARGESVFLG
jgi:hypothetical protein